MAEKRNLDKKIQSQKVKNKNLKDKKQSQKVYNLIDEIDEIDKAYAEGAEFSNCSTCGVVFKQDYVKEHNRYSNFKDCAKCRWKKAKTKKDVEEEMQVSMIPYEPYPWQQKFHEDCKIYKKLVLACSSRLGKNRAINMQFIDDYAQLLNENRHIEQPDLVPPIHAWFVAPTEPMAHQNWRELKAFFPKSWIVSVSESEKIMQTIGGGIIEVRSAYNPKTLVGVALDFCNITEAAKIPHLHEVLGNIEDRLHSNGRGIGGKGGRLVVDSSPNGKNFFYKMWTWGQKNHPNYDSKYISYQLDYTHNPVLKATFEEPVTIANGEVITYGESLKRRKGKLFLQDNLAQFLEAGGTVFPNFRDKCTYKIYQENPDKSISEIREIIKEWKEPKVAEQYRIGYDPASGSSSDSPALVIREMSTNRIVNQIDLYGVYNDDQLDRVAYWSKYYNYATVCVLTTGNLFIASQLENRGVPVIDVGEQGLKKRSYVSSLQSAVQNQDVLVLDDGSDESETLIFQMEDYTENEKTGKFSNEVEPNDDFVSAMYAVYHDYASMPEIKPDYSSRMSGIKRRNKNGYLRR